MSDDTYHVQINVTCTRDGADYPARSYTRTIEHLTPTDASAMINDTLNHMNDLEDQARP